MDLNYWVIAYVFGWLVVGTAIVESLDWQEIVASYIVGLVWPVWIPARLLRRLLRGK